MKCWELKKALFEAGLAQYEAAHQIGMDETRMSRIINGRLQATDEEKKKLSEVLGVSVAVLFPE